ncbi:hypothetical protein [Nonomuraea helvata]|uniref:Uncharacterized protein n=1 Tax=Nonomuraea helvata TaxID=37484 RepID=A0ABV5RUW3_9ACTN
MSEYQYYEFLAIDRPLTDQQQAEVSALSTRAHITATSFTNEYHWGDFRGDPSRMVERYYDAHLYLANWGTHRVMLRLPQAVLNPKQAERYCVGDQVSAWISGEHLILDFTSEAEEEYWEDDVERSLSAIVGIRAELAAGDLRPLYLAWLSAYGTRERDEGAFDYEEEGDLEPPVPSGLGSLSAPQRALADFLRLDHDLLTAAAEASRPPPAATPASNRSRPGTPKNKPTGNRSDGRPGNSIWLEALFGGHGNRPWSVWTSWQAMVSSRRSVSRSIQRRPATSARRRPRRAISHHSVNSRSSRTKARNAVSCSTVHTATAGRSPVRLHAATRRGVQTTGWTWRGDGRRSPRAGLSRITSSRTASFKAARSVARILSRVAALIGLP